MDDRPRLLILEDEQPILFALAEFFQTRGYRVDAASEREEAEALLASHQYAGFITDVFLARPCAPDGLVVAAHAKQLAPATRVLVVSGSGSREIAITAGRLGVDVFLEKPFSLGELATILAETLQRAPGVAAT